MTFAFLGITLIAALLAAPSISDRVEQRELQRRSEAHLARIVELLEDASPSGPSAAPASRSNALALVLFSVALTRL
jgi:hypothetical protein